jgi:hypothetical protein
MALNSNMLHGLIYKRMLRYIWVYEYVWACVRIWETEAARIKTQFSRTKELLERMEFLICELLHMTRTWTICREMPFIGIEEQLTRLKLPEARPTSKHTR